MRIQSNPIQYNTIQYNAPHYMLQTPQQTFRAKKPAAAIPYSFNWGSLILDARRKAGLKQKTLAEMAGISVNTLSNYENGSYTPSEKTVNKLINAIEEYTGNQLVTPVSIAKKLIGHQDLQEKVNSYIDVELANRQISKK